MSKPVEGAAIILSAAVVLFVSWQYYHLQIDHLDLPFPTYYGDALKQKELTYQAIDLPHRGSVVQTNHGPAVESSNREPDFFIFGPYVPVFAGTYIITVTAETAIQSGRVLHLQLASDKARHVIETRDIEASQLPYRFETNLPTVRDLEIRLAVTAPEPVRVTSIHLTRSTVSWDGFMKTILRDTKTFVQSFLDAKIY